MNFRTRLFLTLVLALAGASFVPAALRAQNAPVILSVSYQSTFPTQYIGTTVSVQMTAVQPLTYTAEPFPVSVTAYVAGPTGSVTLGGLFSGVVPASTDIYISDGLRVWQVNYASGNTITIDAADLLPTAEGYGAPDIPSSWPVADYAQLANTTFSVYAGTLVNSDTLNTSMSVDIGQFSQLVLYDNGSGGGDVVADDGIWTGLYSTPNLGSVVTGASFFGECLVGGVAAVNEGFQSEQSLSFDMELPSILTESQTTTNSSYNGDLYLSSLCEGLSAAIPQDVQPSSAQAQFNFTVNKADTTVLITISGSPGYTMTPVTLVPFVFPSNASSLSGWVTWNGSDGNNNFVQDGIYDVSYYIQDDLDGLSGVTLTSQIKVVSLEMNITNITMTPPIINTQPAITNGIITSIGYTVNVFNDSTVAYGAVSPTWTTLNRSLKVLGWGDAGNVYNLENLTYSPQVCGINSPADVASTVWTMQTYGLLDPVGNLTPFTLPVDGYDWNAYVAQEVLFSALEWSTNGPYDPAGQTCSPDNIPTGSSLIEGDGNFADGWNAKGLTPLGTINGIPPGTVAAGLYANPLFTTSSASASPASWGAYSTPNVAPVSISAQVGFNWIGATPAAGLYRLDLQSQLTGLTYTEVDGKSGPSSSPTIVDPCDTAAGAVDYGDVYHFYPQTQVDDTGSPPAVYGGHPQGDFISCQNTSAIFSVNTTSNPTGDDTPPQFLVSSPASNSLLQPGAYSTALPMYVEFQDSTDSFNTSPFYSYITVTGPQGNIAGQSSSNGGSNGSLTLYFEPNSPLDIGGSYSMNAFTCNSDGLCTQQTVPFTVVDTTAPAISSNNGVVLSTEAGSQTYSIPLCQTTPAGPYQFIDQVAVTIAIPGTSKNTIYLPGCSVSLYQVSGTAQIAPVTMTELAAQGVTSSEATLVYQISPPLDSDYVYEVVTQTESQDPSGTLHLGPAAQSSVTDCTNDPEFSTETCVGCFDLPYTNNPSPSNACLAATCTLPGITVTAGGASVAVGSVAAFKAATSSLPLDANYTFLQTAAADVTPSSSDTALEFYVNGVLETAPLSWKYATGGNLQFSLWYNKSDLTNAVGGPVAAANLVILGYSGSSWAVVGDAMVPSSPTVSTAIQCTISVPNAAAADTYYVLAYPSNGGSGTALTGTAVATPVSFPSTRAFNPDSVSKDARFYYSNVGPHSMQVDIYDTAGRRVRSLSVANGGVNANDFTTDPNFTQDVMYYFEWDGTNDAGHVLRNGLYLVRWDEVGTDGTTHTGVKPVALIK